MTHQEDRLVSAWLDTTPLSTGPASSPTAMPILSAPSASKALKSASSVWPQRRELSSYPKASACVRMGTTPTPTIPVLNANQDVESADLPTTVQFVCHCRFPMEMDHVPAPTRLTSLFLLMESGIVLLAEPTVFSAWMLLPAPLARLHTPRLLTTNAPVP